MGIAAVLADYVYKTSYDDLPESVITSTKDRILDFIGTAFNSYQRYPITPVINVLKSFNAKEEATVIGEGIKLPCTFAAMVNCYYDISDGSRFGGGHPACITIPAIMAVAETRNITNKVSGKDLILAIALAYEVSLRIGEAIYPSVHERGFQPTTVRGPMGVAAGTSKLLGLDAEKTMSAISIAGLFGGGLQAAGMASYPLITFQTGRFAEAGIMSALVAQAGLKGSDSILEEGFFRAFSDRYNLDQIEKDLGSSFAIPKTYLKIHHCCRHLHAPIDAALYIKNTYNLKWEEIEQVKVKTYSTSLSVCHFDFPKNGKQADYSTNFGVAVALVHGDAHEDRFTDSTLNTEPIQQLLKKTTVEVDPELDKEFPEKWGAIIEVKTKDNRTLSYKLEYAKGEPENPFTREELIDKFHFMSQNVIDETKRGKIIDFIDGLESKDKIDDLFPLLKVPKS